MGTFYIYDGSFDGLLTAIFDVYDRKEQQPRLVQQERFLPDAFSQSFTVYTDEAKAARVWKGLKSRLSAQAISDIYSCYLSELPGFEDIILDFVQHVFASKVNIEQNFIVDSVLQISQIGRKLFRERHRHEAFVRFQKTADGLFYASIEPDFNVIPLIVPHFERRYADQEWIIYDLKRRYGAHYNKYQVQEVRFDFKEGISGVATEAVYDEQEALYQVLWKDYFKSVNIPARRNMKLHRRHMPQRYWKYLIEKQPHLPSNSKRGD
jgi:probable DNA metabolism protein